MLNDSEMEITTSGEKRKATPPDLLTLSHMYFEKNQVCTHMNTVSAPLNAAASIQKLFFEKNMRLVLMRDLNSRILFGATPKKLLWTSRDLESVKLKGKRQFCSMF